MQEIEDIIFDDNYPPNTKAVINRLIQILQDHKTNSIINIPDNRIDKIILLLILQRYGHFGINLNDKWQELYDIYKQKEV